MLLAADELLFFRIGNQLYRFYLLAFMNLLQIDVDGLGHRRARVGGIGQHRDACPGAARSVPSPNTATAGRLSVPNF